MTLADRAAAGHRAALIAIASTNRDGWFEEYEGFCGGAWNLPAPPLNTAVIYGDHDRDELVAVMARVTDTGLPFSLMARPGQVDRVAVVADALGMTRQDPMPFLVLDRPIDAGHDIPGLSVRELGLEEGVLHADLAAEVFGVSQAIFRQMSGPETFRETGRFAFLGTFDGQPAATALAALSGETVGVYNVATLPHLRGRGLGRALTAVAVTRGLNTGASFAYLHSTPIGLGVYERLGFRVVEEWTPWVRMVGR